MPATPFESVKKPISAWEKPLEADGKKFFQSLTKAVIDGTVGKWDSAASDVVDALQAVGFKSNAGQLAWLLIRTAMSNAAWQLADENFKMLGEDIEPPQNASKFADELDSALDSVEIEVDRNFFNNPASLPVVDVYSEQYKRWLGAFGLTDAQATNIAGRLRSYFVYTLNAEWRRRPEAYAPIIASIDTPFMQAGEREYEWSHYYAYLQRLVNESLFSETFGLKQVYIPLRAYYLDKASSKEEKSQSTSGQIKVVVDLETELDNWVYSANKDDAIRILSGGPGSGKSSFSRMYASRLAEKGDVRVLYIPLHLFDPKGDLQSGLQDYIKYTDLNHNPLGDDINERLLIIFDGLDELAMQGEVGARVAQEFVEYIQRTVSRRNLQKLQLQILLTGREIVVQSNESKFRKRGQILHALPYSVPEDHIPQSENQKTNKYRGYRDNHKLLEQDQRHVWWEKYGKATGRDYTKLPDELDRRDLNEITSQPLLNYLVALSFVRGNLDFKQKVNLNEIYEDLLEAVYKRDWESGRNRNVGHLTLEDFVRILEEIGISTWHRDGRTTTIGIVHNRCKKSGLVHLLKTFQEGAEEGVGRLFAAFYFRQHGVQQDGTKTFEFTHKSFSEYLTAKRLVRALGRMYVEIQLRKDTYERGWDESDALSYWVEIYTNAPRISADLIPFIRNEIALCDTDKTALWQLMLCDLISWLLKHGMPTLAPRQDYIVENQIAVHAEEGLLALLNACARVTQQVSRINYFEENEFAASIWLDRLCGKNMANTSTIFLNCVSYMSFKNCDLSSQRMFEADLQSSDLSGANLLGCNLMLANLTDVNLSNANLGTNFYRAITTPRPRPFEDYDPDDQYFISEVKLGAFISIKSDLPWDKIIEVVEGTSLTNLHEISLMEEPYLIEIDFIGVNLIGTRLPDGTLWHMGRDMSEFTDPT